MNVVVGSGPAGVSCAMALLARGCQVVMLDAANQLEDARREQLVQLAKQPVETWRGEASAFLRQNVAPDRKGVGLKYAYGSDFPYRDNDRFLPMEKTGVNVTASLALGGMSNVWGAALLPYAKHDLSGWPIGERDLAPHYRAAMDIVGPSAIEDDLSDLWPIYHDSPRMLKSSRQATSLLEKTRANRPSLKAAGIHVGAARQAVRADPCVYCALCMYGCPKELIFNSGNLVPTLLKNPNFSYKPGVIVNRVEEQSGQVILHGIDKNSSESLSFVAERAYLGMGVLSTTRLLLESMQAYDTPVSLQDSCYFLMPWLRWKGYPGVSTEALHTLAQLFFEILDPAISPHTVHLQLYTYNDLYVGAIQKMFGPAYHMMRPLIEAGLSRLHVLQGYLHSDHSPSIEMRLTRDGKMSLTAKHDGKDPRAVIKQVMKKLSRHRRQLGGWPVAPMLHVPDPGRGFHNGGTFPMQAGTPSAFQTDTLGRPGGFSRVHAIDSTTFPTIPATTITLSVMANAHRIGSAIL